MSTQANLKNMRAIVDLGVPGVIAVSPDTGEKYSADPADYFYLSDAETLEDERGNPMLLAVQHTRWIDALTGEEL